MKSPMIEGTHTMQDPHDPMQGAPREGISWFGWCTGTYAAETDMEKAVASTNLLHMWKIIGWKSVVVQISWTFMMFMICYVQVVFKWIKFKKKTWHLPPASAQVRASPAEQSVGIEDFPKLGRFRSTWLQGHDVGDIGKLWNWYLELKKKLAEYQLYFWYWYIYI